MTASTFASILTALRYASAVYSADVCPSVRPSVRHKPVLYQSGYCEKYGAGPILRNFSGCTISKVHV